MRRQVKEIIEMIRDFHSDKVISSREMLEALEEIGSEVDALTDCLKEELND
jgi:hypothetical protein